MFLDQRGGWLERVRYGLNAAAYPIQLAVNSPSAARRWLVETFETREALQAENARLRTELRRLALRTQRFEALARENSKLRGLESALPPVAERWLAAEVINVEFNSLRQRVLVNRGTRNGVFKGQAVMSERGLLGQTIHVGPWSAEVILVTDPEHAVPVQIERNGLRTIAVGAGDSRSLALPYLPGNADIKAGDLLLTSGLGGVFPQGYPVARVAEVHRDAVQPLAQVRAKPLAELERDREVMLIWFRQDHPAAPTQLTNGALTSGTEAIRPQPAPPRPAVPQGAAPATPNAGAAGATPTGGSAPDARPADAAPNAAPSSPPGTASGQQAPADPADAGAAQEGGPEAGSAPPADSNTDAATEELDAATEEFDAENEE